MRVFVSRQLVILAFLAVTQFFVTGKAEASIACNGAFNLNSFSSVLYDVSAGTCTISDADPTGSTGSGDVYFRMFPLNAGNTVVYGNADNNLDGTASFTEHNGCFVGDDGVKGAATPCSDNSIASGTYTSTLTAFASAGVEVTLSVTYTVVAGVSVNITSGSVILPGAGSSTSQPTSFQATVSRSQSIVIANNIGNRIANIGSIAGVGRTSPVRSEPEAGGAAQFNDLDYFASYGEEWIHESAGYRGRSSSVREVISFLSFDTSEIIVSQAEKSRETNQEILRSRSDLLASRPWTFWGHSSYSRIDNNHNKSGDDGRFDGNVWGYNLGVDYRFNVSLYTGISLGYSETDLATIYNAGTYDEKNWSVTPYAVYKPIEKIKLSIIGGFSLGDIDQTRDTGSVNSTTDSHTWFTAVNGSYKFQPSMEVPLDLTANLAILASRKVVDAYTESDGTSIEKSVSNSFQIKPGFEIAYSFQTAGTTLQPFTKFDFVYDFEDPTNGDHEAFDLGGGLRIGNAASGWSGAIEGKTQLGREDYQEFSVSGIVAYSFQLGSDADASAEIIEPFIKSDFSEDSSAIGTGFLYRHGSGLFDASLKIDHAFSSIQNESKTSATVGVSVKF